MVFHTDSEEKPVFRAFIREARFSGGEWSSGLASVAEVELARGKIMARELCGPGAAVFRAQGKIQVPNGASGSILLRHYVKAHTSDTNANPTLAKASMDLIATHTVTIAAPGAPAGQGLFIWDYEIMPVGLGNKAGSQIWYSTVRYKRSSGDTLQTSQADGQINVDFNQDMTWMFSMQKVVGGGTFNNTLLDIYSQDAYVRNGEDGQA
jgi:hypothetical protein